MMGCSAVCIFSPYLPQIHGLEIVLLRIKPSRLNLAIAKALHLLATHKTGWRGAQNSMSTQPNLKQSGWPSGCGLPVAAVLL